MEKTNVSENLKKIVSLSKEDLQKIFSKLSVAEIEDLLNMLNEVNSNE